MQEEYKHIFNMFAFQIVLIESVLGKKNNKKKKQGDETI